MKKIDRDLKGFSSPIFTSVLKYTRIYLYQRVTLIELRKEITNPNQIFVHFCGRTYGTLFALIFCEDAVYALLGAI